MRRTLGRLAIPAHGLLPPGLLGYSAAGPSSDHEGSGPHAQADSSVEATVSRESVELTAAVHPVFFGEFAHFFQGLDEAFRDAGLRIRPVNKTMAEYLQHSDAGDVDLDVGRWTADYPDSDTFLLRRAALRLGRLPQPGRQRRTSTASPSRPASRPIRGSATPSTGRAKSSSRARR